MAQQLEEHVEIGSLWFELRNTLNPHYTYGDQETYITITHVGVEFVSGCESCDFAFSNEHLRQIIELSEKLKAHVEAKK